MSTLEDQRAHALQQAVAVTMTELNCSSKASPTSERINEMISTRSEQFYKFLKDG